MSKVWTLEDLRKLSYRDLQKLAHDCGLKANAKKLDLITQLTERLVNGNHSTAFSEDLSMEVDINADLKSQVNDTFLIGEKNLANSTYVVEAENAPTTHELFLSADESILAGNLDIKNNKINNENRFEAAKMLEEANKPDGLPCLSRPDTVHLNTKSGRFAETHKLMIEKMESIDTAYNKLNTKHQKVAGATSAAINRLATPKHVRDPMQRRFRTPSFPRDEKFRFGGVQAEDIESVQIPLDSGNQRPSRPVRRVARQPEMDVKTMTMKQSAPIIPASRIDQLAIPKSQAAPPISSLRRSYTPNRSPYRYVDTTKMNDAEFRAYQREKKQEQKRLNKIVL